MTQRDLFDHSVREPLTEPTAAEVADEAIDRVERNADEEWKATAMVVVLKLARHRRHFTAGDVAEIVNREDVTTNEPRALGAIMRKAQAEKLIEPTDSHVSSGNRRNHNRPQRVWKSLICET